MHPTLITAYPNVPVLNHSIHELFMKDESRVKCDAAEVTGVCPISVHSLQSDMHFSAWHMSRCVCVFLFFPPVCSDSAISDEVNVFKTNSLHTSAAAIRLQVGE